MAATPSSFASPALGRVAVTTIAVGHSQEKPLAGLLGGRGWQNGPVPLSLSSPGEKALPTTQKRRATYLDEHVVSTVLNGEDVRRVHRLLSPPVVTSAGASIWAVEVVEPLTLAGTGDAIAVAARGAARGAASVIPRPSLAVLLHAYVPHDGRSSADVVAGVRSVGPDALPADLGLEHLRVASHRGRREMFRLVFVTSAEDRLPSPAGTRLTGLDEQDSSIPEKCWAFFLASGTLPKSYAAGVVPQFEVDLPTLELELDEHSFLPLSADWQVGVLRDGAAFVGRRADLTPLGTDLWGARLDAQTSGEYYDSAELYVRTLYADVILLGMLQRQALLRLRAVVLAASRRDHSISVARAVESELAMFRERFWWSDVSRGGAGDRLLQAYKHQHGLEKLYDQTDRDASSLADRVHLASDRRRAGALILIGFTSLYSAVLATVHAFTPALDGGRLLFWVVSTFVVLVALVLLRFRDLREAALDSVRRSPVHPQYRESRTQRGPA